MCLPRKVKAVSIQRIAATVGNLMCLNFGLMFGITPAHAKLYQTSESPLKQSIDESDAAWISGYLFLSTAIGCLVLGLISKKIGPKSALLLGGLLQMFSWFCIHFGNEILYIHCSRFAAGLAAGGAFAVLPIFIAEISEEPHRSALLPSIDQWRTLGILVGFILGSYLHYDYVNIIGIGVSLAFNLLFPFVQETPRHYMRQGDVSALEKSLRWYRGIRHIDDRDDPEFIREFTDLKAEMLTLYGGSRFQAADTGPSFAIDADTSVPRSYFLKVLAICLVLMVGAQLSGVIVILIHVEKISEILMFDVSPEETALTLAIVQFFGTNVGSWLSERIHQKLLLCLTSVVSGMSLLFLSLYLTHVNDLSLNPLYVPWLPFGLLVLHSLMSNMGILCGNEGHCGNSTFEGIFLILITHNPSLRTVMMSSTTCVSWLSAFAFITFFDLLVAVIGWSGCLYIFATSCLFVAAFVHVCLPETKGRSLEEMHLEMGYVIKGSVAKSTIFSNGQFRKRY